MVKLVLHQTGEPPKFRQIFSEEPDFVHGAQNGRDVSPLIEDFQKSFADVLVVEELTIDQRELAFDEPCEVGVQFQPELSLRGRVGLG